MLTHLVSSNSDSKFRENDAFIGFQNDTPAAVVFQATKMLKSARSLNEVRVSEVMKWSQLSPMYGHVDEEENQRLWKEAVSQ